MRKINAEQAQEMGRKSGEARRNKPVVNKLEMLTAKDEFFADVLSGLDAKTLHELKPLLEAMHKGNQHVGKVPAHKAAKAGLLPSLAGLRQKLEAAIAAEQYEEAASLRDQIRQVMEKVPAARPR